MASTQLPLRPQGGASLEKTSMRNIKWLCNWLNAMHDSMCMFSFSLCSSSWPEHPSFTDLLPFDIPARCPLTALLVIGSVVKMKHKPIKAISKMLSLQSLPLPIDVVTSWWTMPLILFSNLIAHLYLTFKRDTEMCICWGWKISSLD